MKTILLVLLSFLTLGGQHTRDNKAMLMELKDCAMQVIDQHQNFINQNENGSVVDKGLTKEWISQKSYYLYGKMSEGKPWAVTKLANSYESEQLGQALATYLSSVRIVVAHVQEKINTDADGTINPKKFYPAVFGRLTADEFKKRTGISIKQTTTGKGFGPRNKTYNNPDEWEKKILLELAADVKANENGICEMVESNNQNSLRYIYPLTIKKDCLQCHGDPKGETDISGNVKEGYVLGELRGGISITIPES
jgi:hypothetical protein